MKSKLSVMLLLALLMLSGTGYIYASDLNGVNTEVTAEVTSEPTSSEVESGVTSDKHLQDQENTANAVADMFGDVGIKVESMETAQEFLRPFAKIMNLVMAGILGLTSLLMMFVSVLDLLYMAFPPVRDMLDGGMNGQPRSSRGSRGQHMPRGQMGIGLQGQGMGMQNLDMAGGMSNQGMQQSSPGGGFSALGRWISDEAIAACLEANGGPQGTMQVMGSSPLKSMIFSYMKKRSLFLILFGVCVILFTSTVFTDMGIKLGMLILKAIVGFHI